MNKFLIWIEHLPFASISKIWITTAEYLLLYIIIISLFYFLYDKKSWLLKAALICTLILCVSVSLKTFNSTRTNNISWLNISRHKAIIFKNGNAAVVLTDLKDTDKAYKYSVQPYLDSCKVSNTRLRALNKDISMPWLAKQGGLVQFIGKRVFLLNNQPHGNKSTLKLKTDFIYVTTNPHAELPVINKNFDYGLIIMDGTNSDAYIARVKSDADSAGTKYKILKRNISLVTVSN